MKNNLIRKTCLSTILALLLAGNLLYAQNTSVISTTEFRTALDLYSDSRYDEAYSLFIGINTAEAQLFASKCSYALSRFQESITIADRISRNTDGELKNEAIYLMSLSHFQLGDFPSALKLLKSISDMPDSMLKQEVQKLYLSINNYLSYNQRILVLESNVDIDLKKQVVLDHYNRYPREHALKLIDLLSRKDRDTNYSNLRQVAGNLPIAPGLPLKSIQIPDGTVINVGVLLPSFDLDPDDKAVSRALFNGFLIAVDAFNRQNVAQKIRIHYLNSDRIRDNLQREIRAFKEKHQISAFFGPLFSDDVARIESLSQELGVPFIAPLANTYRLKNPNSYIYQVNPSFEERGRITARLAVETLGLQKFGVMTEKNSHGETDALSFAIEIENLGGEVRKIIIEDFESTGYFVGDHTPWFANSNELIDTTRYVADMLDAVYLPFTGEAASTLLNLTLTGLETFLPEYVVLGNDEMSYLNHSVQRTRRLNMIYTSTFFLEEGTETAANFRSDYLNRTGLSPGSFSYIGFDIGKFFTGFLSQIKNPDDFKLFLPYYAPYHGISTSIYFGDSNSNSMLNMYQITPTGSIIVGN